MVALGGREFLMSEVPLYLKSNSRGLDITPKSCPPADPSDFVGIQLFPPNFYKTEPSSLRVFFFFITLKPRVE